MCNSFSYYLHFTIPRKIKIICSIRSISLLFFKRCSSMVLQVVQLRVQCGRRGERGTAPATPVMLAQGCTSRSCPWNTPWPRVRSTMLTVVWLAPYWTLSAQSMSEAQSHPPPTTTPTYSHQLISLSLFNFISYLLFVRCYKGIETHIRCRSFVS